MNRAILLICSLFSITVSADWQVETFTHAATQSQSQSAMVRNEEGFELAIFKSEHDEVWLDFSLSDNTFDELSQTQLPTFQIDDQKPGQMIRGFVAVIIPEDEGINAIVVNSNGEISTDKDFSVNHIIAERLPERVICPIWQGDDRPHLGTIEELISGDKIRFDYVLLDGTKGQTFFTLNGAKQAIERTIF